MLFRSPVPGRILASLQLHQAGILPRPRQHPPFIARFLLLQLVDILLRRRHHDSPALDMCRTRQHPRLQFYLTSPEPLAHWPTSKYHTRDHGRMGMRSTTILKGAWQRNEASVLYMMPVFRGYHLCRRRLKLKRRKASCMPKPPLGIPRRRHQHRPSQGITMCHIDRGRRLHLLPTTCSPHYHPRSGRPPATVLRRDHKILPPLNAPRHSLQESCMAIATGSL